MKRLLFAALMLATAIPAYGQAPADLALVKYPPALVAALQDPAPEPTPEPTPEPKPEPTPEPKPEPAPVIKLNCPERADAATLVTITIEGVKFDEGSFIFWDVICGDRILDARNIKSFGSMAILSDVASEHPYRVRVFGAAGGKSFMASAVLMIGPEKPVPPKPPTPQKTLADLAGKDAPAVSKVYSSLLTAVEQGRFDTLDLFRAVESEYLADNKVQDHGAKAEIAKRLGAAKTVAELAPILKAIVADLGTPTPTPIPVPPVDDPWNVGATAAGILNALSPEVKAQAGPTAQLYLKAAEDLENGTHVSISQAAKWLQEERKKLWGAQAAQWAPVEDAISDIWDKAWPLLKSDVVKFYRATAAGLGKVQ